MALLAARPLLLAAALLCAAPSAAKQLGGRWTAENASALAAFLGRAEGTLGRKVAVFDFDNTCILNDIGDATFHLMVDGAEFEAAATSADGLWGYFEEGDRNPVKEALESLLEEKRRRPRRPVRELGAYPRYRKLLYKAYEELCSREGNETCYGWVVRLQAGLTPKRAGALAAAALRLELGRPLGEERLTLGPDDREPVTAATGIRPYAEIRRLMRDLSKRGVEVWIVSASGQYLVERAALELFGLPAARVIGTRVAVRDGRLTTELESVPYRAGKVKAIRELIGARPLLAAGDSDGDWEMLDYASDLRILLDRGKAVSAHAREQASRGELWLIQPPFLSAPKP